MSVYNVYRFFQSKVRGFLRKRMMPMAVDEAEEKREFFAKLYLVSGFLLLSYVTYLQYARKIKDKTNVTVEDKIKILQIKNNMRIVKFEGFNKVEDYYYINPESDENKEIINQSSDLENIAETNETELNVGV